MTAEQLNQRKKIILELLDDAFYVPMKEKELAVFLQVSREDRNDLKICLDELVREGKITISAKGKITKGEKRLIGTFISNRRGFGFVHVEGMEDDLFIPEDETHGAFHNDLVEVVLVPGRSGRRAVPGRGRRQEATVKRILEHGIEHVVGTYEKSKTYGFVIPDNTKIDCDIFIPNERSKGAMDGHKVVVEITDYGSAGKNPEGKVVEILGHRNDPGVDILSIVKAYDIPYEFPEKVMNQAARVPEEILEADCNGREDLRGISMVTIDGEDAKDLDDAVHVRRLDDGTYELGVHIADVSNYVQENSALDWEAKERGTSVYLTDRVIPMLPHRLSNGICSLNQGVDRLALSCIMTIDQKGKFTDYRIVESVICVDRRMTYTNVAKIIEDHDPDLMQEYEPLVPMFFLMKELSAILRKNRHKRGSIDFDFPETRILLDEKGRPTDIRPYERNSATMLIEDFMLAANETVAQHFYWLELPFVYRTHEAPDMEKIQKLSTFLYNMGYHIHVKGEEVHPKEIQKLIGSIEGTPEEAMILRLTLRSMKQAKYTTECTGHFGLACDYYCHFTSPIRRYPDLQIHRIIKEYLRGRMKENRIAHYDSILPQVAEHSSRTERRAEEAERETEKLKKAQYMSERIGETYTGVISGVTAWGIYVELPNTVEGMVALNKMEGDYYLFDETLHEVRGKTTGQVWKLGQTVTVQVKDVDFLTRSIDFALVRDEE
ncbi:MAG: ribonuclease R [Lachnospiraceae bacterium]